MNANKCPISIWIIACAYLAVGSIGFVYHFHLRELLALQRDSFLIELTELLAIVSGAFLLRGQNWARWLALAWMGFHVAISFPVLRQLIIHSLLFAVIAWFLFRPEAARYFHGTGAPR
jgi:hypothetical protein